MQPAVTLIFNEMIRFHPKAPRAVTPDPPPLKTAPATLTG